MNILVAYDGSEIGRMALARGIELVKATGGDLLIVTVVEPIVSFSYPGLVPTGEPMIDWKELPVSDIQQMLEKQFQEAGQHRLAQAQHVCDLAGVKSRGRMELGSPRIVICEVAKEEKSEIIVIGSRGLGAIKRLLLGSVSEYVVRHAPCSVLVVHPEHDESEANKKDAPT